MYSTYIIQSMNEHIKTPDQTLENTEQAESIYMKQQLPVAEYFPVFYNIFAFGILAVML